jgi:hypothetical protein
MLKKIFSSYIVLSVLALCYALFSYFTKEGIEQLLFVIIGFLSFVAALSFLLLPLETPSKSYVVFYSSALLLILISIIALKNPIVVLTYWKGIIVLSLFHFLGILTLKFLFKKGKFWQYILIFNSLFFVGMLIAIFFNIHTMLYFTTVGGFFLAGSLCVILNLLHKIKVNIKH